MVGDEHDWSEFGGIIAGFRNTVSGGGTSVLGGSGNVADSTNECHPAC